VATESRWGGTDGDLQKEEHSMAARDSGSSAWEGKGGGGGEEHCGREGIGKGVDIRVQGFGPWLGGGVVGRWGGGRVRSLGVG
jgi:hypothetical protein